MSSAVSAIITAAGSGSRMQTSVNKVLLPLKGNPVLAWSLYAFCEESRVTEIVVAAGAKDMSAVRDLVSGQRFTKPITVVEGGGTRADSVLQALKQVAVNDGLILVHDGARPLLTDADLCAVLAAADTADGAILAVPVKETVKLVNAGSVTSTPGRDSLYIAQTPQVFRGDILRRAYDRPDIADFYDDSSLVEAAGGRVVVVPGSYDNIKLTTFEDFILAGLLLDRREKTR